MATSTKKFDFKTWWAELAPKRRQQFTLFGVAGGVVLISWAMLASGGTVSHVKDPSKEDAKITNSLLPDENTRDIGMTGIAKDVEGQREESQTLSERVSRVEEIMQERDRQAADGGGVRGREQQMRQELDQLREQISDLQKNGAPAAAGQGAPAAASTTVAVDQAPPGYGSIRTVEDAAPKAVAVSDDQTTDDSTSATPAKAAAPAAPKMYLPSGSIISGIMLTGLDAPTGKGAMKDPVPVLVRIQAEAILPNLYRADIKECFALVAGQGDLASERAYLRSESISCVRRDKSVIDLDMKAYVVDTDGKAGLRGRLVSKQGSVLGKAIIASFADGVSQAFKGNNSNSNIAGGQIDYGQATQSGAVQGVSSSLDRISKYYLDLADQLFPILEIDAGRKVTLVLVKGLEMSSVR